MSQPLSGSNVILQTPIVDPKTGFVRREWIQFFRDLQTRIAPSIDPQGQVVGTVTPEAEVDLGSLQPGGATAGQVLEFNGTNWVPASLAAVPQTFAPVTHEWLVGYDAATGLFTASQPAFSDLSGSAVPGQLPIATNADVGVVKPDGTSITVAGDGTLTAAGGGTGGILSATVTLPVSGLGTGPGTVTASVAVVGATTSMVALAMPVNDFANSTSGAGLVTWIAGIRAGGGTVDVQMTVPSISPLNWTDQVFNVRVIP